MKSILETITYTYNKNKFINFIKGLLTLEFIQKHLFGYLSEVFEVFIVYILFVYITNNEKYNAIKSIRIAFIVAFITYISEIFNPKIKSLLKTGIVTSIGSNILKSHFNWSTY